MLVAAIFKCALIVSTAQIDALVQICDGAEFSNKLLKIQMQKNFHGIVIVSYNERKSEEEAAFDPVYVS